MYVRQQAVFWFTNEKGKQFYLIVKYLVVLECEKRWRKPKPAWEQDAEGLKKRKFCLSYKTCKFKTEKKKFV